MDRKDLKAVLDVITDPDLEKANRKIHIGTLDREKWIATYFGFLPDRPNLEARCVQVFQELGYDVKTEQEKNTAAAESSAKGTATIADEAKEANRIAKWALSISALAFIISMVALWKGCQP